MIWKFLRKYHLASLLPWQCTSSFSSLSVFLSVSLPIHKCLSTIPLSSFLACLFSFPFWLSVCLPSHLPFSTFMSISFCSHLCFSNSVFLFFFLTFPFSVWLLVCLPFLTFSFVFTFAMSIFFWSLFLPFYLSHLSICLSASVSAVPLLNYKTLLSLRLLPRSSTHPRMDLAHTKLSYTSSPQSIRPESRLAYITSHGYLNLAARLHRYRIPAAMADIRKWWGKTGCELLLIHENLNI